jgi:hypothetical protein
MNKKQTINIVLGALALSLAACGAGGSSAPSAAPPVVPVVPPVVPVVPPVDPVVPPVDSPAAPATRKLGALQ